MKRTSWAAGSEGIAGGSFFFPALLPVSTRLPARYVIPGTHAFDPAGEYDEATARAVPGSRTAGRRRPDGHGPVRRQGQGKGRKEGQGQEGQRQEGQEGRRQEGRRQEG